MSTHFSLEQELLQKPTFPAELWDKSRKDKDFMPILFEWYKYIGGICNILASISRDSPAIRKMPALNYAILTGLLNRCSRLMLSNIRLSVTKKYGETIMLLDRSIYESAVTVQWLCYKDSDDCFQRYLAEGIKSDLKIKDHMVIPLVILETLKQFIEYVVPNSTHREPIESILAGTRTEMLKLTHEIVSPDFEFDPDSGLVQQ
ncbi:hypothetical protein ES707_03981 [subsurface metagenome]